MPDVPPLGPDEYYLLAVERRYAAEHRGRVPLLVLLLVAGMACAAGSLVLLGRSGPGENPVLPVLGMALGLVVIGLGLRALVRALRRDGAFGEWLLEEHARLRRGEPRRADPTGRVREG